MRPSVRFFFLLAVCACLQAGLIVAADQRLVHADEARHRVVKTVAVFGLSDLCIATDARYVRHFAVSDKLSPFMDHPGAIEHFPTGSFWIPEQ